MGDSFGLDIGQCVQSEKEYWYKNIQYIGQGGNAVVFLVMCVNGYYKGGIFALKVFKAISKAERKAKFLAEREFLRTEPDHPAILHLYDSGEFTANKEEHPFIISEYLPFTLKDIIRRNTRTIVQKLVYTLQMLSALKYLTELGNPIVHRDIKPSNIFIKGESCVLGDFGLMKYQNREEDESDLLHLSPGPGMPVYYRTPDLIDYAVNRTPITCKSDVFQLGLVLTHLFTGRNPAISPRDRNPLTPLELEEIKYVPGVYGSRIRDILSQMLEVDKGRRPRVTVLIDWWQGIFEEAMDMSHKLNGKVL